MADLLDANVLIESWHFHYPPTVFPGVWEWFALSLADGRTILLPQVRAELTPSDEGFEAWLSGIKIAEPAGNEPLSDAYRRVENALAGMNLAPRTVERFLAGADFHLVAHALAGEHCVVTREQRAERNRGPRPAKIPAVCDRLGVDSFATVGMFERHGARFDLRR